ncbi:esterase [Cronobacter sakazakii]|uniref:Esterase n=2 Tax=Cronobacter sakazakii TaxID=28141 RepID=A0AA45HG28_CROSK|nr:esterase [Cronobacter sakazakii]EIZ8956773.1 esterase [Cronobacter sakazakii]EJK9927181.1 esterase [Cronobacter sakazakii]ELY2646017.1 esterase [Cronobacter sakazakii]ELY2670885.1 esterase [Cronobacter sakazakii]ELY2760114.1 esterase [Cronobacter sakazakii]
MIEISTRRFAGIEALHAVPAGEHDKPLPTVMFYHGFTSSKTVYSYFAVALAQAGFRVIMPDAPDHGARFSDDAPRRMTQFWQILHATLTEYPALRDAILNEGLVADGRLAVGGASMGGMTALGIMSHHPEVKCVASLMGSGWFSSLSQTLFPPQAADADAVRAALAPWDVGARLPSLSDRPLFLWHGEEDDVVPAAQSLRLADALRERALDNNLTCQWQPGVKHRITPEALDATVAFFRRSL